MPHPPSAPRRPTRLRRALAAAAVAHALAVASPALAQEAPAAAAAMCASIPDDRDRLACYDRAVGAVPAPAAPPADGPAATLPALGAPTPATLDERARALRDELRAMPSTLGERWELDAQNKQGRWQLRPYRPVFVLPAHLTSSVNRRPTSDGAGNALSDEVPLRAIESVFQLSLKSKLAETIAGSNWDLWAAYTQVSHWQVWTPTLSRPFRETNYEPEVFAIHGLDVGLPFGWRARYVGLGINHQSNGRGEPLSRSWNRVIAQAGAERGDWAVQLRAWRRLGESADIDDNPGIQDFVGRAEAIVLRRMGANLVSLQLRHSLRLGDASRGSVLLDWAVPLSASLKGHVRVFSGYGETLIDFNHRQTTLGVGISLAEWL